MARRTLRMVLGLVTSVALSSLSTVRAQAPADRIVPLRPIPSAQWVELVSGDPSRAGSPFVLRIHNDAGFRCMPHTHPTDENIVVVKGQWLLGMGRRFDRTALDSVNLGAFARVPTGMPHFCWSPTETVIQVHGTGPFAMTVVDPLYELTASGVVLSTGVGQPPDAPASPACVRDGAKDVSSVVIALLATALPSTGSSSAEAAGTGRSLRSFASSEVRSRSVALSASRLAVPIVRLNSSDDR